MTHEKLILASGSPQRRDLLTKAGYDFVIAEPDDSAEAGICSQCGPAELVVELSLSKAKDATRQLQSDPRPEAEGRLLVACDTVAECGGLILGKPTSEDHAAEMLDRLRGTVHRVYSGLTIARFVSDVGLVGTRSELSISHIEMQAITDTELDDYVASGMWEGKAGSLGFQDRHDWLQIRQGSESNVIGLPMELLAKLLALPYGQPPHDSGN